MPNKTSRTALAAAAGAVGWALLPSGALVPVAAAGGAVLVIRIRMAHREDEVPRARQVQPKSLWADWDLFGQDGGDVVVALGERTLWQVGPDGFVIEQDGIFRPVSILAARQLAGATGTRHHTAVG